MKKATKISLAVAVTLLLLGAAAVLVAFAATGFDIGKIGDSGKTVEERYEADAPFSSVFVEEMVCTVRILPSGDGTCYAEYRGSDKIIQTVTVEDGVLTVRGKDTRRWYERIGIFYGKCEMCVYMPEGVYENLTVRTDAGNIAVPEAFTFRRAELKAVSGEVEMLAGVREKLSVQTTSGDIQVQNTEAEQIELHAVSGSVSGRDLAADERLSVQTTSGDIRLEGVRCGKADISTTSGAILWQDVCATGDATLHSVSGDIRLSRCDAASFSIETTSGGVNGTLLSEKVFSVSTTSGRVQVPSTSSGGVCRIKTVSGDVHIELA